MAIPVVDQFGTERWYNSDREYHRVDGPAVIYSDGTQIWYLNGLIHREDGPAVSWPDGTQVWYVNGVHHRIDGPAIEYPGNELWWFVKGELMSDFPEFMEKAKITSEDLLILKLKHGPEIMYD